MNWSAYVLGLIEQGHDTETIVALADNPFITPEYVKLVRYNIKRIYAQDVDKPYQVTKSETLKVIDAYVKEIGVDAFMEEYKTLNSTVLGKKLNVPAKQVRNYVDRYIRTMNRVTSYRRYARTLDERMIWDGKKEPPPEKVSMKEFKNLW